MKKMFADFSQTGFKKSFSFGCFKRHVCLDTTNVADYLLKSLFNIKWS